jgi:cytochrome c-type protein NapB
MSVQTPARRRMPDRSEKMKIFANRIKTHITRLLAIAIGAGVLAMASATAAQDTAAPASGTVIKSLRSEGSVGAADVSSTTVYKFEADGPPLPRDFIQQPPLIPHGIRGYTVTRNFNKCMDCHAWSRARETGATKVSLTHFRDRQGNELAQVSPRRYFCMQCHVPQTNAKPLVENTFVPAQRLH